MITYVIDGTILSPVHIGTGDELNPFDYIIRDGTFIRFQLETVLSALSEEDLDTFYRLNDEGDINRLRQFISERVDENKHACYMAAVTPMVARQYMQKIHDISNQLIINPTIRDGHAFRPYIPGSSLKGAIRTAVVSELAQETSGLDPHDRNFKWEVELKVLKYGKEGHGGRLRADMGRDPFRMIKIRDILLEQNDVMVTFVRNMGRNRTGQLTASRMQMIHEVLLSEVMGKLVSFSGELLYDKDLAGKNHIRRTDITPEYILNACNAFYIPKLEEENEKFYERSEVEPASSALLKVAARLKPDECLVRVGRFSGCESVTLDKYRNVEFGGRTNVGGNTRNVCEERYPMGWIKLKITPA